SVHPTDAPLDSASCAPKTSKRWKILESNFLAALFGGTVWRHIFASCLWQGPPALASHPCGATGCRAAPVPKRPPSASRRPSHAPDPVAGQFLGLISTSPVSSRPVDSRLVTAEPTRWTTHPRDAVSARKENYEQLRRASTCHLLAARMPPAVLAILQALFPAGDRRLPLSELGARAGPHVAPLHDEDAGPAPDADTAADTEPDTDGGGDRAERPTARGGRSAAEYVDAWVREGYLTRRDDQQHTETTFEPSPATIDAIQFIVSLEEHRPTTTQSRLQLVIQQFERLAEETETDRDVRLADLQRRRERIEAEIRELAEGELMLPSAEASVDKLRDILQIA